MPALTLNPKELYEITGRKRSLNQIEALRTMNIPFRIRPDGSPIVLRAVIEVELGYAPRQPQKATSPRLRIPHALKQ